MTARWVWGLVDRRKFLAGAGLVTAGGAAGAGAGVGAAAWRASAAEGPTARTATPDGPGTYATAVTFRAAPAERLVALTIDDGPTAEWTPQLLSILAHHDAKATFFRIGRHAGARPDLVQQTADAGHEQGNHTWAHDDLTKHDETFDRHTLERTHELLAKLAGQPPALCRPPWGRIDSVGLAACASLHYDVALWSHHVTGSNPVGGVDLILRYATPGSIVLAHDGGPEPNGNLMQQLDRLVGSMMDAGYRFVTLSALLTAARGSAGHGG